MKNTMNLEWAEHQRILASPTTADLFIPWVKEMVEDEAHRTEQASHEGGNGGTVADYLADVSQLIERLLDDKDLPMLAFGPEGVKS